jgi:protein SCO1/2
MMHGVLLFLLALTAPAGAQAGGPPPPDVGIDQRLGEALPLDARFLDEQGRELPLVELFGERPVILALVYYECPMLCTLVLKGLCAALADVSLAPGVDYDVVAVSIDPGETPELARAARDAFAARLGGAEAARGLHFLCGAEPEIARLAGAAGFRYAYDPATDQYAHAAGVMVVTPEGRLARYFYGIDYPPRDLRLALVEASAGRIGSLVDQVLLLCLHYDPATGRYGLAVQNALRLGGGATVLLLGGFVVRSLLADRRRRARAAAGTSGGEA